MLKLYTRYNKLRNRHIVLISLIISVVASIIIELKHSKFLHNKELQEMTFVYIPIIFLKFTPILLVLQKKFLNRIKTKPMYSIYLNLYFLLFIPIFLGIYTRGGKIDLETDSSFYLFITVINLLAILFGHIILVKYVFLDILFKKRKTTSKDTIVILMTYVSMGVSFGFLYALVTILSGTPVFNNMPPIGEMGDLKLYLRHIYYSFITLTSVGFGDIYPLTWLAQLITVVESILGVFLLSFSLGIILSSTEESEKVLNDRSETLKKELLEEIEILLDKKLKLEQENKIRK